MIQERCGSIPGICRVMSNARNEKNHGKISSLLVNTSLVVLEENMCLYLSQNEKLVLNRPH